MFWLLYAIWSFLFILYFSCFFYLERFGKISSIILLKIFLHIWLRMRLLLHLLYIAFVFWYYPRFPECFLPGFSLLLLYVLVFLFVLRINISLTGWTISSTLSSRTDILSSTWSKSLMRLYSELFVWIPESFHFKFYFGLAYSAPPPRRDSIPLLNSILLPWIVIISFNSVFMVFTHAFIHILFELLEQVYNCYFEVLYIS